MFFSIYLDYQPVVTQPITFRPAVDVIALKTKPIPANKIKPTNIPTPLP